MERHYFEEIDALPRSRSHYGMYMTGFLFSLLCTLAAYELVVHQLFSRGGLIAAVTALALIQCTVQAICFLHIDARKRSRLKLFILSYAILIVAILVGGSIWIMVNLNLRMMQDPSQMQHYMQTEGGF